VTAVRELERRAEARPRVPECSASVPVFLDPESPPPLMRCPEDAVGLFLGRCPCGHLREGWLCGEHAEMLGLSGCRACFEDEDAPHDCPLSVTPVTMRGGGHA